MANAHLYNGLEIETLHLHVTFKSNNLYNTMDTLLNYDNLYNTMDTLLNYDKLYNTLYQAHNMLYTTPVKCWVLIN